MDSAPAPPRETGPVNVFRKTWAYVAVIVIAVTAVYGQSLSFDFVTYDDYDLVVENEAFLSSWSSVLTSFTTHAFTTHRAESGYYRPLLLVSYIVDYHLWELNPAGFHLTNLLLHLATCLLVFGVCRLLLGEPLPALLGTLLFALHPVQSEPVAWVAGRNDLLLGLFVAAATLAYIRYRLGGAAHRRKLLPVLFFSACALFTKESAAFYLFLLPLVDAAVNSEPLPALFSWSAIRRWLPMAALLAAYLAARAAVIGELIGAERLYGSTPFWERVASAPALLAEHLRLLVLPSGLSIAHPAGELFWNTMPWRLVSVLVLVAGAALVAWSWRRDRTAALGLSWIALGLLPVMNVLPLAVPILEHRLYVPMEGAAVGAAAVLRRLGQARPAGPPALAAAGLLLAAAGLVTMFRLPVWKNSESLWLDTIRKAPGYSRSYLNLAGYYYEQGRFDLAAPRLEEYLALRPGDPFASARLRATYVQLGERRRAIDVCRRMIAADPANPARYLETALFFEQLRMTDSVVAVCRDGLGAGAESGDLQLLLGRTLTERGDTAAALPHLRRAVELAPAAHDARLRLGTVLWRRGETGEALRTLEPGLEQQPPNELIDVLVRIYLDAGERQKAQALLDRYGFR